MSDQFRGVFAEEQLGVRTQLLPASVLAELGETLERRSADGLVALLGAIGKRPRGAQGAETQDDRDSADLPAGAPEDNSQHLPRTPHLLFLTRQEIEAVVDFARNRHEALAKVFYKKKADAGAIEKLRHELEAHLAARTTKNAVDVGLFGRFITSSELDSFEGALQVAHGLGTQQVEIETDFFTSIDDLKEAGGAARLGETEFASSVVYLYACCDLDQLERNLGRRTPSGREADAEARALARRGLPPLIRAMAETTPIGMRLAHAPNTRAEYVEVVVRHGCPLSLANAFCKPVHGREAGGDVLLASVLRLKEHRDRLEGAYRRDGDVTHRFVLSLREPDQGGGAGEPSERTKTLDELCAKVTASLVPVVGPAVS